MFGYIVVNKEELKIKEYNRYRSYYCGLCEGLKKRFGRKGQLLLSYDMTFLVLLLTALYERSSKEKECRCIIHPVKKHRNLTNEFTQYGADMTILLAYHKQRDDWEDDRNLMQLGFSKLLKSSYNEVKLKYERQSKAVEAYMKQLHVIEKKQEKNLDYASGVTGTMLGELFVWQQDEWAKDLFETGFYLGKFIYLLDAYDDLDKDMKRKAYNPLAFYYGKEDFDEYCREILLLTASGCARAFERLPIVEEVQILRNILYSGIWCRFEEIMLSFSKQKRKEEKKGNE